MADYLVLIIAICVVAAVVVVGLVVAGVRRKSRSDRSSVAAARHKREHPSEEPAPTQPDETAAPDGTDSSADGGAAVATEEPAAPEVETPAPAAGRLVRLRARLAKSQTNLGRGLLTLLSRDILDEETWDEVEESLLAADVGVTATQQIVDNLRTRVRVLGTRTSDQLRGLLREELLYQLGDFDRTVHSARHDGKPAVVMVVGVNGTGKTTTVGKLGRVLIADGKHVLLGAADTFRAAAADQLETWGGRVGAETVRGDEGADPASVAYEAVRDGAQRAVDAVLVDTAGRLHTKQGLMDELGKVKRVVEKQAAVDDVLLVLDATTGQNGLMQARVFAEVVDVTGLVLTKLDGTAKGGIVIAVQRDLGVPVKLVGLGEGPDDLAPFVAGDFVDALLGDD